MTSALRVPLWSSKNNFFHCLNNVTTKLGDSARQESTSHDSDTQLLTQYWRRSLNVKRSNYSLTPFSLRKSTLMSPASSTPTARWRLTLPLLLSCVTLAVAGWWTLETLILQQTLREGRTVADMAENVGRWASQYGGVHARTVGIDAKFPGNFLTRSIFAATTQDESTISGASLSEGSNDRAAMTRVETYYWKNPALVQREIADVITASGSLARYRLTARSVLNESNAPNAFELTALNALQQSADQREYWEVKPGQILYARAIVAQKSCLLCHTSPEAAPEFIRSNPMFNHGGGYGYVEGKPVGLISVSVPLQTTGQALAESFSLPIWLALGASLLALLALLALIWQAPIEGQRDPTETGGRHTDDAHT